MLLYFAQAEEGPNWIGIIILGFICLLVLGFIAGKFQEAYEERGPAGIIGCITTIIIIVVIRALIIYFRENG